MSKNTCPICGQILDDSEAEFLDNGSPAHPKCVQSEINHEEEKDAKEKNVKSTNSVYTKGK